MRFSLLCHNIIIFWNQPVIQNIVTDQVSFHAKGTKKYVQMTWKSENTSFCRRKRKSILLNLGADKVIYGLLECLQSHLPNGHMTCEKLKEMPFHCISLRSLSNLFAPIMLPQPVTLDVAKNDIGCYVQNCCCPHSAQ